MSGPNPRRRRVPLVRGDVRWPRLQALESRLMLSVTITPYAIPTPDSQPYGIATGPDGNIWFTENQANQIGTISLATGKVTEIPLPSGVVAPEGITSGPDGELWFVATNNVSNPGDDVCSINPTTHAVTTFSLGANPTTFDGSIAAGPDGNLWMPFGIESLVSLNPATGVFHDNSTPFPAGYQGDDSVNSGGRGVAAGPDGNIWYTESLLGSPGGAHIAEYIDPTTGTGGSLVLDTSYSGAGFANGMTADNDGNLWFNTGTQIDEVNVATQAVAAPISLSGGGGGGGAIALGPDGNIWFTGAGSLGMVDTATRAVTITPTGSGGTPTVDGITAGPDGAMWFINGNSIDRAQVLAQGLPGLTIGGSVSLGAGLNPDGPGLPGETVYLDLNHDGRLGPGDPSTVTDSQGEFTLTAPVYGTYTVRIAPYPGDTATTGSASTVTLAQGEGPEFQALGLVTGNAVLPLTFSAAPFGPSPSDVATAELDALYATILGRAPDPGGFAFWKGELASGLSIAQVSSDFLNSAEYESDVVASYYQDFLGRAAAPAELFAWVSYIRGSGASLEQIADLFLTSTGYNALHASDADFVQSLYGNLLGRQGTTAEVAAWTSYLAGGGTRAQMVQVAIQAADTRAVEGDYETIFGRPADPAGLDAAMEALQYGFTLVDLDVSLFGSGEFATRAEGAVTP